MTTNNTSIVYREALPDELHDVFALGHAFFAERGMPKDYYDDRKLKNKWDLLGIGTSTALFTAWEHGNCLGGIGIGLFDEAHSSHTYVGEVFFFVLAEHRGRGISNTLRGMAETWGKTLGAHTIRMGRFSSDRGLGFYYASHGYKSFRVVHEKELT